MNDRSSRKFIGVDAILTLIFGFFIVFWPAATANLIAQIIAFMLFVFASIRFVNAITNPKLTGWLRVGPLLLAFIYGLAALIILINSQVATTSFFAVAGLLVGLTWLFEGVLQLSVSDKNTPQAKGFAVSALLHLVAGLFLMISPLLAGVFLWLLLGWSFIILGLVRLFLYFTLIGSKTYENK